MLAALALLVFAPHIADGGRYSDDWPNAAFFRFDANSDLGEAIDGFREQTGGRPVNALLNALVHELWTDDISAQLGLAIALAGLCSLLFFIVLRTIGVDARWAGAAAVLSFIYPWADAARLWPVAGQNQLSVILYLLGVWLACRGLAIGSSRGRVLHGAAVACYVLSILSYEAASFLILATGMLYVWRAGWQTGSRRWLIDVAVCIPAVVAAQVANSAARHTPGLGSVQDIGGVLLIDGPQAVARSILPFPASFGLRAAILISIGILVWLALRGGRAHPDLRTPVAIGAASLAAAFVAWTPFAGADLGPLEPGLDNRGSVLAAFPLALAIVALCVLVARSFAAVARWPEHRIAVFFILAVGVGWGLTASDHADDYDRSAAQQAAALEGLALALPDVPAGTAIYTTGHAAQTAPGVPVFSETWDLNGAVKLLYDDPSLRGFPIVGSARLTCTASSVIPRAEPFQATALIEEGYGEEQGAAFGEAILVDVEQSQQTRIVDRASCMRAAVTARGSG